MRKIFLFTVILVLLCCKLSVAQFKITGKVLTSDQVPLAYAELVLTSEPVAQLKTQLSNEDGAFIFEASKGSYKLEIRQFKQLLYSKIIMVEADLEIGTIQVNDASDLGTVQISQRKAVIERKIDRLVFNIENTISSVGGDALDALKITPGVMVRNETITIVGKQSVRVLVDDKMVELGAEDLASFLRSIPSDNIKNIEVITTPPAKYDAAGGSGLINIKLKKAKADSWSLSFGSSYLRRQEKGEGALTSNFMYNKDKLSLSTSLNYRDGGESFNYQDYITFPSELWNTQQLFRRNYKRFNAVLGMQYVANDDWQFGIQYIGNYNKTKVNRATTSLVYNNNEELVTDISSLNTAAQKPNFNSINFFNEIKFDSLGKKIIINFDYFNYANNDSRPYEGTSIASNPYAMLYFKGINDNAQKTNNYSGKIDLELPTKWANWSTGAKVSISNTANYISAFNSGLVDNPINSMPQTSHDFSYRENVQGLYFSGNKKFNDQFETQVGLRMETTQTKSFNGNTNKTLDYNYTKLFPTINLSYAATANSTFRLSYGRRIARPNFSELNPNVTFITPFLTVEGNQVLKPYFIDNYEFIYSYKKLESKLFYSAESDVFNQIALPNVSNNNVRLIYQNIYNLKRYGFIETYTFDKWKWWSSNNLLNLNYLTTEVIGLNARGIDGLNAYFRSNNDFTINKNKTLLFNLSFDYFMTGNYGIDKIKPFTFTSLAIQYFLMNKDLRINFRANDIFKTDKYRFASTISGVHRNANYYFDSRMFQLSVNYKFGSSNILIKKRQTGNEEERARTGN